MKSTKTSITIAAIAGLIALGPSARAQTNDSTHASTNSIPSPGRRAGGVMSVTNQLSRLSERLKLTDEQKPKVKAVLEEQNKQLRGLRDLSPEDRRPKMRSVREETNKKMKEILTDDQYKQFEEMRARGGRPPGGGNVGGNGGGNAGGNQ
jgi:Spy/CpxP family protein refolding chaperone